MARAHRSRRGLTGSARIQLCGELAVEWDGESLTDRLPGRQGRLLFAYLALHRDRPVRRDELEEAVGGAQLAPPLSRLRKALGAERLVGRSDLRLALPADAWIDREAAFSGLARARVAMAAGDWPAAWGPAGAARAIAARGLLPGLEAPWIDPLRADLADLHVEALEALARIGVALGGEELAPAERAAREAVEAAPFRESAHAVLIDALAARGNIAEAVLAYESLRTLLRDELGTTPSPDLTSRHTAMLQGSAPLVAPGGGTEVPPHPAPASRPGGTEGAGPLVPSLLIEREREVALLSGRLDSALRGEGGVVVVEGPAGVGKTRLLDELRGSAAGRGVRTLTARSVVAEGKGELERRRAVEALGIFTGYWWGVADEAARWSELREQPPEGDGFGTKMLLAATAWQWAVSDGPADRCVELALRALEGGTLLRHDPALMAVAAGAVLGMADHEAALAPWDTLRREVHDRGSAMVTVPILMWRGWVLGRRGELAEAESSLKEGDGRSGAVGPRAGGPRVHRRPRRRDAARARRRRRRPRARDDRGRPPPGSDLRAFLVGGRAALALAEHDPERAVAVTDELADHPSPIANPAWVSWRSSRALGLHETGRHSEAVALAWEDYGSALRWGVPATTGRALRVLATVEHSRERLNEAVRLLEHSGARLELAKALAAAGEDAAALALAEDCGATALAAALRARGARAAATEALSALERQVAALADQGADARTIAQTLFLTPKAAQDHLETARRKLGVGPSA